MLRGRGNIIPPGATDHSVQHDAHGPPRVSLESLDSCSFESPLGTSRRTVIQIRLSGLYSRRIVVAYCLKKINAFSVNGFYVDLNKNSNNIA